ncbi:kinase-like domain-containing protein [Xylariales sp. PMI_506]|nr:kinase-like domain-containing protein [Xylariales sp. PMI_506]
MMENPSQPQMLPESVLDSKLEVTFQSDGQKQYIIHHRPGGHRSRQQDDVWVHEKHLGRGGQGSVCLQRNQRAEPGRIEFRAVKSIFVQYHGAAPNTSLYVRELEALAKFSQARYTDFFVKLYGWYESPEALHIAMEYCEYGDLHSYVADKDRCPNNRLPEDQVQEIASQVLGALHMMHHSSFAHRDLKPANILIKRQPPGTWWVKVCDLGLSKRIRDITQSTMIKGTLSFMPPEHLFDDNLESSNLFLVDMWCLGETLVQILTGRPTFRTTGDLLKYYNDQIPFPNFRLMYLDVSAVAIDFLQRLMTPGPKSRLTADQALEHEWMNPEIPARADVPVLTIQHSKTSTVSGALPEVSQGPSPPSSGHLTTTSIERGRRSDGPDVTRSMPRDASQEPRPALAPIDAGNDANALHLQEDAAWRLYDQEKYAEAEQMFREILSQYKEQLQEENSSTLRLTKNIGNALSKQQRYQEAKDVFQDALNIGIRLRGRDDPNTLNVMHNLAYTLRQLGNYAEAETVFRETFQRRRTVLGKENLSTLNTLRSLAYTIGELGKHEEAADLYLEALEIQEKVLKPNHPDMLNTMRNFAWTLVHVGRLKEAEELYEKTLELQKKALGSQHPDTLETETQLADWRTATAEEQAVDTSLLHQGSKDSPASTRKGDNHPHFGFAFWKRRKSRGQ